jgi:hypothetical protein
LFFQIVKNDRTGRVLFGEEFSLRAAKNKQNKAGNGPERGRNKGNTGKYHCCPN